MLPKNYKEYHPLPKELTIRDSQVHGQGLFAKKNIQNNVVLGESHYLIDGNVVRTPLSGFINHSESPNCTTIKKGNTHYLVTTKNIFPSDEITLDYNEASCSEICSKN
jgi:SET domain-containing protein